MRHPGKTTPPGVEAGGAEVSTQTPGAVVGTRGDPIVGGDASGAKGLAP